MEDEEDEGRRRRGPAERDQRMLRSLSLRPRESEMSDDDDDGGLEQFMIIQHTNQLESLIHTSDCVLSL